LVNIAISLYSFTPNTKAESAKVNANFTALKNEVEDLRDEKTLKTVSDDNTITFDLDTSHFFTVTLGGNRALAVAHAKSNEAFVIRLVQDSSGNRTVTWWSGIRWPGGTAPTLTTTPNAVDAFGFICTGENSYDGYFLGFDLR